MAISNLWRKFEAGFTAVTRREDARVGAGPDDLRLRAYGDYVTAGGRIGKVKLPPPGPLGGCWLLSEGSSEILKAQFELLAIDAGRALDPPPPGQRRAGDSCQGDPGAWRLDPGSHRSCGEGPRPSGWQAVASGL